MYKKILTVLIVLSAMFSLTTFVYAEESALSSVSDGDIVIIHTNDVHCNYTNYSKVAALAEDADLLVDAGDAIQGGVIGTLSKGEYIVDIMNYLEYDLAVPGNHEFDYGADRFLELAEQYAAYPYVACNFITTATGTSCFDAYKIFEVNGTKIAFVGIATPESFTKSTPTYFQDANGNYIYSFCEDETGEALYAAVQNAIDAARNEGADYVIALAHLGIDPSSSPWTSAEVIANTTGLDVMIDGHSHSIVRTKIEDKDGHKVILQQTGSKLGYIGKITIKSSGTISYTRINTDTIEDDPDTADYIAAITEKFDALRKTVVARSEVGLTINGADGLRAVRKAETNLGDLCADAIRIMMGADIGLINGGGIRANISIGDITYGDIVNVHPFGNEMCLVEVSGQQIKDALEMGAHATPDENGGFLQVSGLTYTIHTAIPSSVVIDDQGMFVEVNGDYRVSDIMVGEEPLDVNKTYKLASHNYMLKNAGDGYSMFGVDNVTMLLDCVITDNQLLINYIVDELGGVVGQQYAAPAGRIIINDKPVVGFIMGDLNGDGRVNLSDLSIFRQDFGKSGDNIQEPASDLNGDGRVNLTDLSIFRQNFGKTAS